MKEQVLFIALYALIGFIITFYICFIHDKGATVKEMVEDGVSEGLTPQLTTSLAYSGMFVFGTFWPAALVMAMFLRCKELFTQKQS